MSTRQVTTSAALFCDVGDKPMLPLGWLETAVEIFQNHHLAPILFTASGGGFAYDDCYVLADAGGDLVRWGEVLAARRDDLVVALQSGAVEYLRLDSPRAHGVQRSDWRACVSASASQGRLYVGVDEELVSDPAALLKSTFGIAKERFDVCYGIAYKMPLDDEPDCYASGVVKTSVSEAFEFIRHRREWDSRQKTPDELWSQELYEPRRHLTGLFRGAYPASILSDAHVQAARLHAHAIGKLSKLDTSLWLWELSESEIPKAEAMLRAENALVSQMTQQ
jgi:hypothetical protein